MAILKIGHPVICLTDSDGAKHSLKDVAELEATVKSFQSVDELAKNYEMDARVLTNTIREYNEGVTSKADVFSKPFRDDLTAIDSPPFYATRLWPKVHHTMGGLHINSDAQVMHIDGYPIEGLYAAGEVVGGVHGGDRLGSCATLDCISFGRISGHNAAAQK
jgi:succinate dehydrogenase/fumarate reductase flavoprotein subunit